jgi:hypothetical protein
MFNYVRVLTAPVIFAKIVRLLEFRSEADAKDRTASNVNSSEQGIGYGSFYEAHLQIHSMSFAA